MGCVVAGGSSAFAFGAHDTIDLGIVHRIEHRIVHKVRYSSTSVPGF